MPPTNALLVLVLFSDLCLRLRLRHILHVGIPALLDSSLFQAARVQEQVVALVPLRPRSVGSGEVLARDKRVDPALFPADNFRCLQLDKNPCVDLGTEAVIGRDD